MPTYRVEVLPSVEKALRKLPDETQRRIVRAVMCLGDEPRPSGCRKLSGEDDVWRIRIGDYRVLYTIEDGALLVLILRIAHRKDAYR